MGFEATNILQKLGINTDGKMKALLCKSDIATEIDKATGEFKKTLEEIQKTRAIRMETEPIASEARLVKVR